MKFTKWTALRLIALCLTVTMIWCSNYDRSPANWSVPVDYRGDSLIVLGLFKAASQGDFVPFLSKTNHRLGAPYEANWDDWPVFCEEIIFGAGLLAKWLGLLSAANAALLLAFMADAVAFYACCRLMRFRWEWSFVVAVLYAFTYFHSVCGFEHITFTYSHMVPFALLSAWMVAFARRLAWGTWPVWMCLVTAAVLGFSNPYFLNMFAQLICLGLGLQILFRRRKINIQVGLACLAVSAICFLAINLDTFSYGWKHGKNAGALARGYYETELFALKPMEMVVPPVSHHIDMFARIGSKYLNLAWLKGEVFSPYLGIICILGLGWMTYEALSIVATLRRKRDRLPAYGPQVLWILVYSVVGGLNCVIGLFGLPLFRGTNRFSIFISALVLLFLASRLSRLARKWSVGQKLVLGGALLGIGLYDQLPQKASHAETNTFAQITLNDREFCRAMEQKLKPGAMVFQLPVMPFPESTPVGGVQSYEHMRPYIYTETLRFSFGSNKGRSREDWQKDVEKLPAEQMRQTLERYGFSAIYLNRRGYQDRGEALLKQLQAVGHTQVVEDEIHEQVCVLLNPAATPVLPPTETRVTFALETGWVRSVDSPGGAQHWTSGDSQLSFQNPEQTEMPFSLVTQVGSLSPQRVSIEVNGKKYWSADLAGNQLAPAQVSFTAKPGKNRIVFKTDSPPRPTRANPLPQAFVVVDPRLNPGK